MIAQSNKKQIGELAATFRDRNVKEGLRDELNEVPGLSRMDISMLMRKVAEDVILFSQLKDVDDKYDFLK